MDSPHVARKLLPTITEEQVQLLLKTTESLRDKCIIAMLFDSGLRLSEVCSIKPNDIDWSTNTLSVLVKGNREAKAAFTPNTAALLREYIARNGHSPDSLFGMTPGGVQDMQESMQLSLRSYIVIL